jgi:hypothetical protein
MSLGPFVIPSTVGTRQRVTDARQLALPPVHLWRTLMKNNITVDSLIAHKLERKHIVLVPGPQHPAVKADERLLHVSDNYVFIQNQDSTELTWPNVNVIFPNATHYAIRCWVVSEHYTLDEPSLSIELDRIVAINGSPYLLEYPSQHNTHLTEICARLQSSHARVQFNVMWRGEASCAAELLHIAKTVVPYNCIGIRFEEPSAASSASDMLWLSDATGAPPIDLISDIAKRTITVEAGQFTITPASCFHASVDAYHKTACDTSGLPGGVLVAGNTFRISVDVLRRILVQV